MMTSQNGMMRKWEILKKYLEKWHKLCNGISAINTAAYVLSDFKESDDDDVKETHINWNIQIDVACIYIFFHDF